MDVGGRTGSRGDRARLRGIHNLSMICMEIYISIYKYMNTYIDRQKERERERDVYKHICTFIYICIYVPPHRRTMAHIHNSTVTDLLTSTPPNSDQKT